MSTLREKIAVLVDQAVDDLLKEQGTWFAINSRTTDRILALLTPVDTVSVRIAVAVDPKGFVSGRAIGDMHDEGLARMVLNDVGRGARVSFITADVPKPQPPAEITGRVE